MKLFAVVLTVLFCVCLSHAQCVKLNDDEGTRQGYSVTVVYIEKKPYKFLRGTAVLDAGENEPLEDVLVEVFVAEPKNKELKRVAGCRTGADGKFSFSEFAKGRYILRLSKDGGFGITEIHVKISPKSARNEEILGFIGLGA